MNRDCEHGPNGAPVPACDEWHSIADIQATADERGIPGPSVDVHPDGYDGDCLCRLCLSYA